MFWRHYSKQLHLTSDNESSSKSILAEIILVLFPMTPSLASDGKTFFQSRKLSKNLCVILCNNWYRACSEILSYSSAIFSRLRATRAVNSKLAFTQSFFYSLIILIKLCKIRYLKLDKALIFPRNQVICLKNWKIWRAPTTIKFNIFFAEILLTFPTKQCLQESVRDFLNFV